MRYFITVSCYGCRLHGDDPGSVDRLHSVYGGRLVEADLSRMRSARGRMTQAAYVLDEARRDIVLGALREVCLCRGWNLLAAHVRTTHVHVVVEAEGRPERVMADFKTYASRWLNRSESDEPGRKRWARHGSTRWLWTDQDVRDAVRYVVEEQGEPMAVFIAEAR